MTPKFYIKDWAKVLGFTWDVGDVTHILVQPEAPAHRKCFCCIINKGKPIFQNQIVISAMLCAYCWGGFAWEWVVGKWRRIGELTGSWKRTNYVVCCDWFFWGLVLVLWVGDLRFFDWVLLKSLLEVGVPMIFNFIVCSSWNLSGNGRPSASEGKSFEYINTYIYLIMYFKK